MDSQESRTLWGSDTPPETPAVQAAPPPRSLSGATRVRRMTRSTRVSEPLPPPTASGDGAHLAACFACGYVGDAGPAPMPHRDDLWEQIALTHAHGCRYVATRGYTREV